MSGTTSLTVKFLLVSLVVINLINMNDAWFWVRSREGCHARNCKVTGWSSWSDCTSGCPAGNQTRDRSVWIQPKCEGTACPDLMETRSCNLCHNDGLCLAEDGCMTPTDCYCKNGFSGACCEDSKLTFLKLKYLNINHGNQRSFFNFTLS